MEIERTTIEGEGSLTGLEEDNMEEKGVKKKERRGEEEGERGTLATEVEKKKLIYF